MIIKKGMKVVTSRYPFEGVISNISNPDWDNNILVRIDFSESSKCNGWYKSFYLKDIELKFYILENKE